MERETIERHYFKDGGQRPFQPLMSGLPLPLDADGVCRNKRFVDCDFHPVCSDVTFENCEFINGQPWNLKTV